MTEAALLTRRLSLRRFTVADAANVVSLDGDSRVMRFLERGTKSVEEVRDTVLPRLVSCHLCHPGFGYWAAETRTEEVFIGWFGLRPVTPSVDAIVHWPDARDQADVVELGYRLRCSAWGQGYATEGARALVRRAFADPGVREIVATTMAVNVASRRVMEKAGMSLMRTVHVDWPEPLDGTEEGEVEYRLRRNDWRAGSGP